MSDSVFTTSQKYIFNVQQFITSCGKFDIFLARALRKKYRSKFTETRHFTQRKLLFSFGEEA